MDIYNQHEESITDLIRKTNLPQELKSQIITIEQTLIKEINRLRRIK